MARLWRTQERILDQPDEGLELDFDNVDHELAVHLLQIHWNIVDRPSLVTYRPTFREGLLYSGNLGMNKILMNAVFFSSSLYSDRKVLRCDLSSRHSVGAVFCSRFQDLLSSAGDQISIVTVMVLVICATSLLARGHGCQAVELLNQALRMLAKLDDQESASQS